MEKYIFINYICKGDNHPEKIEISADTLTKAVEEYKKILPIEKLARITYNGKVIFNAALQDYYSLL